jgi:hypothetical protein
MRDRDRKREADRERRARIKSGTWDFPNGGAAEFAKAGAAIHTASKRLGRSSKSPESSANPQVLRPAPAPRRIASAPHVITPTSARVVRSASTSLPPPSSMVAIGGVPGRGLVNQGYGYPAPPDIAAVSTFAKWRENTETMLATLAAKADIQDRRIAALEASQADRRAAVLDFARAVAGLFSYANHVCSYAPRATPPKASTRKRPPPAL